MTFPTRRQSTTSSQTALTAVINTYTLPSAAVAGNLLVACLAGDKNTGTVTAKDDIATTGTGWGVEVSVPGASASQYIAWKVATGGETTITLTTSAASATGNTGYAEEMVDDGSGAWTMLGKAVSAYSDTAAGSKASGNTPAVAYDGRALAATTWDSQNTATGTAAFSNGFTLINTPTQPTGSGGGNAACWVGTKDVAAGTTTNTTFSMSAGTDQCNIAVVVFGRVEAAANPVPTVDAGADATIALGATFNRTATETLNGGPAITARAWTVVSGPAQVGATLTTTAALSWTPATAGTYVLGYTATNANGTSPRDDVTVTVTGPVRTLDQAWLGLDAIAVKTTTNISADTARVAFSTSSGMTSPVYSASLVTPDANGISKHPIPALAADTAHWYQVELGGTLIGAAQAFRTLPGSGAQSFTFGFSSCRDHVDNFPSVNPTALADAVTRGIDFFLEIGDFHYRDISTNDQSLFRAAYDEFYTRSNIANLLKSTPTGYVWDDHDYGGDNSNGGTASRPAAQAIYRERVPHPALPSATGGIYHTWVTGRVRFIMLDCRSFRSPNANTDNSSKTMLGTEQKTWLQGLLNGADTPLTVIVSSVGWVGGADSAQDHWGNYSAERTEVGGWITANGSKTKCVFLSGDAHMLAYDNGTNSVAGAPQYHAAALNQTTSTKGGPYSGGSRASSNAYGYVSVVDSGSQIDFTYSGYYDGGTLWASHTTTVSTGTTHSRAVADTVGITDTAAQAATAARGIADTVGLTDSPAATATTSRVVADTIGVIDSPSTAATTSRVVADTVGLSDATAAGYELTRTVADSIGITDQTTTQVDAVISRTLADTIGVSDAVTRSGTSSRTIADTVGVTDQSTRTHTAARALADGIGLADATTLEIATPPPTPGGLAAVLYLIDKATGARTPLTGWTKLSLSPIDNAVGALVVTYASGAPGFSALHDGIVAAENRDALVELRIFNADGRIRRYRGFLQQKEGDDLTRGASWAFTGAVVEQLLAETLIYPGSGPGYNDKKELQFSGVSPGTVLITAVQQSQGRGGLPGVTWDFTTTHDSNGAAWASTLTNLAFSPATTVLALAQKLVELQTADFVLTADLVLRAFNPDTRGVDRSTGGTPLRFSEVANLIGRGSRRESSRTPDSGTAVLAKGKEGFYGQATDATALANRGRRVEVPVDAGDIATDSGVTAAAQAHMQIKKTGKASYEYNVAIGAGRPAPGFDFDTGDYAQALVGQKFARRKISQWVLEFERGKAPACTVALNDLIPDPLVKLARALAAIGNGGAVVGTSTATPGGEADTLAPAAPTGLVVSSNIAYGLPGNATRFSEVTVGWDAVTTNTDGTAADDVQHYRVRYAYLGPDQVGGLPSSNPAGTVLAYFEPFGSPTTDTQLTWGEMEAGAAVGVQVAAVDTNGNQGPWSTRLDLDTQADDTPPAKPSTPTATDWFGTVRLTYDGLDAAGADIFADAPDIREFEIHSSASAAFTVDRPLLAGALDTEASTTYEASIAGATTWNITDLPIGVTRYFRIVAVDNANNASEASDVAAAVPRGVELPDMGPDAVGSAQIIDLAVLTAHVGNAQIVDAKVNTISIGKATAGTLSADVILAGNFRTATSGNRIEFNSTALRLYKGTAIVGEWKISDGSILITGTFRTGTSGERVEGQPDGTLRWYPAAGSNYSQIANLGNDLMIRGILDGNGRSGRINVNQLGVGLNFSSEAEIPNNLRSEIVLFDSRTRMTAPNHEIVLNGKLPAIIGGSGGARFVAFYETNSSGTQIPSTRIEYKNAAGVPGFAAIAQDAGWKGEGGYVLIVNASMLASMPIKASDFIFASSETVKEQIEDARALLDPIQTIRGARAKRFIYTADRWHTPPPTEEDPDPEPVEVTDPPARIGPMAEDLPAALVQEAPSADGSGPSPSLSVVKQLGVLWAWANQKEDQRLLGISAAVKPPALTVPNTDVDVTAPWDEGTAQTLPAVVSVVPVGPGPLQQRAITARVVNVTTAGVTVRFRAKRALTGVAALDPDDRYIVNALYLHTPPFEETP